MKSGDLLRKLIEIIFKIGFVYITIIESLVDILYSYPSYWGGDAVLFYCFYLLTVDGLTPSLFIIINILFKRPVKMVYPRKFWIKSNH